MDRPAQAECLSRARFAVPEALFGPMNVGQILHQAAARWPERVAVLDVGHPGDAAHAWSFGELDHSARRMAAGLRARGVAGDACIALIGENSAHFAAGWFAIAYSGATVVPIPTLSSAPELRYRIEHARCSAVLCDGPRRAVVEQALAELGGSVVCLDLAELANDAVSELARPEPAATATAMVLYTSGTSGAAKGAAISHASLLLHTALLAQRTLQLGPDDRVLGVLPLSHSFGCRTAMLVSFFVGARCVLMPRFDAARSFALLHDEAITWVPAVPTMFAAWGALPAAPAPPALRWALSAGAPLPDAVAARAEERLGVEVRQAYGMTEATICTVNAPPDARVFGSVGKPVWGIEVRLLDADARDAPAGDSGEIAVRGHNAMSHYLHDPASTRQVASEGFIRSGDVGRVDDQGRLFIVDRIKDLIIRGGYNVYPSEVEAALALHPEVAQVAVVGRPDAYYGEEVVAIVARRPGSALDAAALLSFARAELGRTKRPREVAFCDAFPLGPSGKVLKRTLRQWLLDGTLRVLSTPSSGSDESAG